MTIDGDHVEVRSADGTALSARVFGTGTPLVLVHGTGVDSRGDWMELPDMLAEAHTVWCYDRRGRGASGDGPSWELAREVDDVCAVLAAVGEPAHLLGHSFGAVCSLKVSATGVALRSLVLYEPPLHVRRVADAVERAVAQFDAGDAESGLATFLIDVAGSSRQDFEALRAAPEAWGLWVSRASTIRREIRAVSQLGWRPKDFASVRMPALYLAGGLSEGNPIFPTRDDISEALPQASYIAIPDQGHVAFANDPKGFAAIVLEFTARHNGHG